MFCISCPNLEFVVLCQCWPACVHASF